MAAGTSSEVAAYAGPVGEIVVNTDDWTLHVQDGLTAGGHQAGAPGGNNYDYRQPASGATLIAPAYLAAYTLDPTAPLASLTVVAPAAANDGQLFEISTTQTITALTVSPASGQSLRGGSTLLAANGGIGWRYRSADATWYRRF